MSITVTKENVGRVSVIIPFYNQSEFIQDTVDSIKGQTYTNWEIIIVDDGSDEALPISPSENIVVIHQSNKGQSFARNVALDHAKGEFIQFLDADDLLHPHKFESQIRGLRINNTDVSVSGYLAFTHPDTTKGVTTDTDFRGDHPFNDLLTRWEKGLCIPIHCFLYRRYVIDRVGRFDTSISDHEDWDFHLRVAANNFSYCHDPSQFALYRIHPKSRCRRSNTDGGYDVVKSRYSVNDVISTPRHNLLNTTFVYCVKIDSEERLRNLDFAMSFMWRNFYTNILLVEEDAESHISGRYRDVKHIFIKNDNPIFHRTRLLNGAIRGIETEYFCNIDIDVFTDVQAYIDCCGLLETTPVVYPYNGKFYDMPSYYAYNRYLETKDVDIRECGLINPSSYGGMVFFRKKEFIEGGMENENFVGWGFEDWERFVRFSKLGYAVKRLPIPIFHFTHPRGVNSGEDNPNFDKGRSEYEHINILSKEELRQYVKETFTWAR